MNSKLFATYILILASTIFALFLVKYFDISYPLTITSTTKSTELAVVGEGKIETVPDTASVEVGITVNDASTVEAAQNTINETNNKIIDALKKLGIDKQDIKTSNYSIYPNTVYDGGKNRISGYNGNVTLTIKVKDVKQVADVVQEATKAGANQIFGTRFNIDDPAKYREQAREKAIQNARAQAEKLASSLGIRLGKVVNIVESTPGVYYPVVMKSLAADGIGGGGGPSIEPGSQTISSTVTLYFEKK